MILAALCVIGGTVLEVFLVGYRFSALLLWGLGLLALALFGLNRLSLRRRGLARGLRAALAALLALGLALLIWLEIPIVQNARTDDDPEAPWLIVLGAGVNGTEPSLSLLNRLETALEYMEAYPEAVAVVSGGQGAGEDISEARAMETWLLEKGVAPERIVLEDRAENTWENIAFSVEKIRELGETGTIRAAIVTSDYHLYRGKTIAAGFGIEAVGVAAETTLPVLKINYYFREAFAVLRLRVTGG